MQSKISGYLQSFRHKLDTLFNNEALSFERFIEHYTNGEISFIYSEEKVDEDKQELLEHIKSNIKYLNKIAENPKQHLKVEELFRAVELARRINPRTVFELSRNSRHWQSRTVNEVKPSKLLTEIGDDELAIYENRALKTLLDDLSTYVDKEVGEARLTLNQLESADILDSYFQKGYRVTESLRKILGSKTTQERARSHRLFSVYLKQLEVVQQKLILIKSTPFYRSLLKCRRVQSPLEPTNILIENAYYRVVYKLWNELAKFNNKAQTQSESVEERMQREKKQYLEYVFLLLTFTFFDEKDHNVLEEQLSLDGDFRLAIVGRAYKVEFRIEADVLVVETTSHIKRTITIPDRIALLSFDPRITDYLERDGDKLIIHPDCSMVDVKVFKEKILSAAKNIDKYKDKNRKEPQKGRTAYENIIMKVYADKLEPEIISELDNKEAFKIQFVPDIDDVGDSMFDLKARTEDLYKKAQLANHSGGFDSTYHIIPADIIENNHFELNEIIVRRLNTIGEGFVADLEGENVSKWGNYKTGILLLTPRNYLSPIRVLKAVNASIFRLKAVFEEMRSHCPACHSSHIEKDNRDYHCKECDAKWSMTKCGHCNDTFTYLDLNDGDVKKRLDENEDLSFYEQAQLYEAFRGEKALTQKRLLRENGKTKFVSICPKCGN